LKFTKVISIAFLAFIFIFSLFSPNTKTQAESNGLPFSVEPVLPSNQNDNVNSYISVSPESNSSSQDFEFILSNSSEEEQEIAVNVVDAYTSPNGVIQYVKENTDNSTIANKDYKLSNYLEAETETITLQQDEAKTVSTSLNVENMDGVLLGGVSFSAIEKGEQQEGGDNSFQINNKINMVVGVMVSFDTDQEAEFIIDDPFVDPMPSYFAIRLPMTLDAPFHKPNIEINYEVSYKDEKIFDGQKDLSFAPYSKTNIALPWEYEEIKENETYTIKGHLTHDDENIGFEEDFVYDPGSTSDSEGSTISPPSIDGSSNWIYILVPVLILLVILLLSKSRNKYALLHDEVNVTPEINIEHDFYNEMKHIKDVDKDTTSKYMDIYKRKKDKENDGKYVYVYKKTKEMIPKQNIGVT